METSWVAVPEASESVASGVPTTVTVEGSRLRRCWYSILGFLKSGLRAMGGVVIEV